MTTTNLVSYALATMLSLSALAETHDSQNNSDNYFDYTQTYRIWVHRSDGTLSVAMSNPLSPDSVWIQARGRELYELILPYMAGASAMLIPMPDEPEYVVDLLAPDRYKRLYLGHGWINDGRVVAIFSDGDWHSVVRIIEGRFEREDVSSITSEHIENKYSPIDKIEDITRDRERHSIPEAIETIRVLFGDPVTPPYNDYIDLPLSDHGDESEVSATSVNREIMQDTLPEKTPEYPAVSNLRRAAAEVSGADNDVPAVHKNGNEHDKRRTKYVLVLAAIFFLLAVGAAVRRRASA